MPKKQIEPVRPYYAIKHEFNAAQKRFENAVSMLFNTVDTIRKIAGEVLPEKVVEQLDEQLVEFRAAAYGKD